MNNGFADHPLEPLGHPHKMELSTGFEPATSSFVARRSIHLSYESIVGRKVGFEPTASRVTVGRSSLELLTPYILWKLVDSNHINRIFSPTHTPCLPSFLLRKQKDSNLRSLYWLGTLAECCFKPLNHASFVLTMQSYIGVMQSFCVTKIILENHNKKN